MFPIGMTKCTDFFSKDSLDILDLVGIRCDLAAIIHATTNRRGRYYYNPLSLCVGYISSAIYSQLDLQIFLRGLFPCDSSSCWNHPDRPLFGLFLHLLHEVSHPTTLIILLFELVVDKY